MIDRTKYLLAAALLMAPMAPTAAHAQHSSPATPHAATAPALAADDESFPNDATEDEGMWVDDDLLAFGLAADLYMDDGDLEGGADSGELSSMEGAPGPDGQRRIVMRDVRRSPGGMGRAGMGAGMQGGRMGRSMMHGQRGMALRLKLAQLDLTDAQRARLRDLHEAHARRAIQRRADMQLARLDLRKLMSADRPSQTAVNAQIDRLARMHAEGLKSAFELRLQAKAVLTPEQVKQLHSPMAPMMRRHGMMDGGEDHSNH